MATGVIDYALAVERLYGVAEYGKAHTYEELVRTWRDPRSIPSREELEAAYRDMPEVTLPLSLSDRVSKLEQQVEVLLNVTSRL